MADAYIDYDETRIYGEYAIEQIAHHLAGRLREFDPALHLAVTALRDYLLAAHAAGIRVNRTTAAQLGWAHARSGYLAGELFVNADPESRRLERFAYHGGRCEAFRLGEIPGTTYSLDVRACYATICLDERLPCQQLEEYRAGCAAEQIDTAGPDHWIADVIVQTDEADYPLRWHGSPIFPVGQFRTALPWPELRHALAPLAARQLLPHRVVLCGVGVRK